MLSEVSRGRSTELPRPTETGRTKRLIDKEEPSMTSRRRKPKPATIDFSHEALASCFDSEPQRGQSNVAAMEKSALDSTTMRLMEQVVHWSNMHEAWKAVRANHGAPGPDAIAIHDFTSISIGLRYDDNCWMALTNRDPLGVSPSRRKMAVNVHSAFQT